MNMIIDMPGSQLSSTDDLQKSGRQFIFSEWHLSVIE